MNWKLKRNYKYTLDPTVSLFILGFKNFPGKSTYWEKEGVGVWWEHTCECDGLNNTGLKLSHQSCSLK